MEWLAGYLGWGHREKPRLSGSGQSEQSTSSLLPTIGTTPIDTIPSEHTSTQSLPVPPPACPPLIGPTPGLSSGSAFMSVESSTLLAGGNVTVNTTVNNYEKPSISPDVRQKIVDWLSPLNYYAIQKDTFEKVSKGTGEWLLRREDFKNWLSSNSGTLWGVGIPGAGKTYLTSIVINHLMKQPPPFATEASPADTAPAVIYAFCRYNDKLSASQILASLLAQLVDHSEVVAHYVEKKMYDPCMKKKTGFTPSEVTATMQSVVQFLPQVYIVIDALDELQDTSRHELVDFLVTLQKSLFMTSRDIRIQGISSHNFNIRPPFEDFRSFFNGKLSRLPHLKALFDGKEGTLDEIIKRFEERSDGMFLLAALQLSVLDSVTTISNLRKGLERLPKTLKGMYSLTLERIKAHEDEKKSLALRAILWITYATRSLELDELLVALATEPGSTAFDPDAVTNEGTLVSLCSGLLTVEKESRTIRLVHFTAQDFFNSYQFEIPNIPDPPHSHIAAVCAAHLNISRYNWKGLAVNRDFIKFARSNPFCDYACSNLGHHLTEMLATVDASTAESLLPTTILSFLHRQPSLLLQWTPGRSGHLDIGTAIHFAAFYGIIPLIDQLSEDINAFSTSGYTPLYYAFCRDHTAMLAHLLANPNIKVNDSLTSGKQKTLLHVVVAQGHDATVRLLLATPRIDVNVQDDKKMTALHLASVDGDDSVVKQLLATPGIDVNKKNNYLAWTALHNATDNENISVVQQLLSFPGIEINAQDENGWTALHLACRRENKKMVQLFLGSPGINADVRTTKDWREYPACSTALDIATKKGNQDIVAMFKEGGYANDDSDTSTLSDARPL